MTGDDRPTHRKKKTGRPAKAVERLAEDFGDGQMDRALKRQLKAIDRKEDHEREIMERTEASRFVPDIETDSFRIVLAELAKSRGGPLLKQQALWLIGREEKNPNIPAHLRPNSRNQAAVEKWLRNPLASSYWAAMRPRKKKSAI